LSLKSFMTVGPDDGAWLIMAFEQLTALVH
jgi:hypothetical protein